MVLGDIMNSASAKIALLCTKAAIDKKAVHSLVFEVGKLGAFTDYFLITSGTSDRQVQAIADEISRSAREAGVKRLAIEGYDEGRWILIDFGAVVVHVFQDAIREYYNLEALWSDAPRLSIPQDFYTAPQSSRPHATS